MIGRQGEQAAFKDALQQSPEEATQFLFHIHGPAGVGKSTLIRQLESVAREAHALTAYIDESTADVVETMESISSQFTQQGVELKGFDKLLATYRQRQHEADASAGLAGVSPETTGAGQETEQQGPSPSSVIGSQIALAGLGMIPGVGTFTGVLDPNQVAAGADRFKMLLSSRLRSHEDVQLVLSPLQVLTPVFLRGLGEGAGRRPWVVIFFDTYERTGPLLDVWLRDILVSDRYGQLPTNVLVVLAGQSRLNAPCWGDWLDLVTDLPLEVFTDTEARQLLSAKGISDEKVVEVILDLSGRLPVLVSTLAEAHPSSVADVGDPSDTAVERFLKWETNPVRRAAALACALPQELDEDTYRTVVDDEAKQDFSWLRSMPFFINRAGRGHYHDVVRSAMLRLQRQQSPVRWKEQHTCLADAFQQRRVQLEDDAISDSRRWDDERWRNYRLQETYHRLCADYRTTLPHTLRELLDAHDHDHDITTLRRWTQTLARAGQDTDAPVIRSWAQELLSALEGPHPGVTALTLILSRGRLDPAGKCLAYMLRGREHRRAKGYKQALVDYTMALELEPTARGFRNRGECYRLEGRHEEALADFNRAIEIDPDYAWTLASRAQTYRSLGRRDEALADYNHAIELEPERAWIIADRGFYYDLENRHEEALADFNRAIEIDPAYAWAFTNRGRSYQSMGRYEEALADYNRAIELDNHPWAVTTRGRMHHLMGRHEDALADCTRAIEIDPNYKWAVTNRGEIYQSMGRHEDALADYTRAIEIDPAYAWAFTNRGKVYKSMGRYEEALADYTRAIEIEPTRASIIADRGNAFRIMGRHEESLADFNRAIEIDPSSSFAISNRGVIYRVSGQYQEALTEFNRAIELNPNDGWIHYEKAVTLCALDDPEYEMYVQLTIEFCSTPSSEAEVEIVRTGNLVLVHCLTADWMKAKDYLSDFLRRNPTRGRIVELHSVMGTLRQVVSSAEENLQPLRYRLEAALAE